MGEMEQELQVQQQEISAEDERPAWLPPNFKDPEALAKSYEESRKEMDRLRSQLDEERQQFSAALEQVQAVTQQAAQPQVDPANQLLYQYQQAVESGDAATQLAIQAALMQQAASNAVEERFKTFAPQIEAQQNADRDIAFRFAEQRVAAQYGEQWADLSADVDKWLREHPAWMPTVNTPDAFETVIGEAARYVANERAAARLAEVESARAARLSAQTGTGSTGRYPTATDEKKQAWDEIKSAEVGSYSAIANRGR